MTGRPRQPYGETDARVFLFVKNYIDKNQYSPSIREIMDACSLGSTSTTNRYLRRLEGFGMIERLHHTPRAIKIL